MSGSTSRWNTAPIALSIALFVCPLDARAYCRTTSCELGESSTDPCERDAVSRCVTEGQPTHWPTNCLSYAVQLDGSAATGLDGDQLQDLVAEAFRAWQSAPCAGGGTPAFAPVFQGFVACDRQQAVCGDASENVNVFLFHDDAWPGDLPPNALAVTTPIGSVQSGLLIDADIEFNSANYSFTVDDASGVVLRRVLAHELGHFLGLSHSEQPGALMSLTYQDLPGGDVLLTADDIAAICDIFPPQAGPVSCIPSSPATDVCATDELSSDTTCSLPIEAPTSSGCSVAIVTHGSSRPWLFLSLLGAGLWHFRTSRGQRRLARLSCRREPLRSV